MSKSTWFQAYWIYVSDQQLLSNTTPILAVPGLGETVYTLASGGVAPTDKSCLWDIGGFDCEYLSTDKGFIYNKWLGGYLTGTSLLSLRLVPGEPTEDNSTLDISTGVSFDDAAFTGECQLTKVIFNLPRTP